MPRSQSQSSAASSSNRSITDFFRRVPAGASSSPSPALSTPGPRSSVPPAPLSATPSAAPPAARVTGSPAAPSTSTTTSLQAAPAGPSPSFETLEPPTSSTLRTDSQSQRQRPLLPSSSNPETLPATQPASSAPPSVAKTVISISSGSSDSSELSTGSSVIFVGATQKPKPIEISSDESGKEDVKPVMRGASSPLKTSRVWELLGTPELPDVEEDARPARPLVSQATSSSFVTAPVAPSSPRRSPSVILQDKNANVKGKGKAVSPIKPSTPLRRMSSGTFSPAAAGAVFSPQPSQEKETNASRFFANKGKGRALMESDDDETIEDSQLTYDPNKSGMTTIPASPDPMDVEPVDLPSHRSPRKPSTVPAARSPVPQADISQNSRFLRSPTGSELSSITPFSSPVRHATPSRSDAPLPMPMDTDDDADKSDSESLPPVPTKRITRSARLSATPAAAPPSKASAPRSAKKKATANLLGLEQLVDSDEDETLLDTPAVGQSSPAKPLRPSSSDSSDSDSDSDSELAAMIARKKAEREAGNGPTRPSADVLSRAASLAAPSTENDEAVARNLAGSYQNDTRRSIRSTAGKTVTPAGPLLLPGAKPPAQAQAQSSDARDTAALKRLAAGLRGADGKPAETYAQRVERVLKEASSNARQDRSSDSEDSDVDIGDKAMDALLEAVGGDAETQAEAKKQGKEMKAALKLDNQMNAKAKERARMAAIKQRPTQFWHSTPEPLPTFGPIEAVSDATKSIATAFRLHSATGTFPPFLQLLPRGLAQSLGAEELKTVAKWWLALACHLPASSAAASAKALVAFKRVVQISQHSSALSNGLLTFDDFASILNNLGARSDRVGVTTAAVLAEQEDEEMTEAGEDAPAKILSPADRLASVKALLQCLSITVTASRDLLSKESFVPSIVTCCRLALEESHSTIRRVVEQTLRDLVEAVPATKQIKGQLYDQFVFLKAQLSREVQLRYLEALPRRSINLPRFRKWVAWTLVVAPEDIESARTEEDLFVGQPPLEAVNALLRTAERDQIFAGDEDEQEMLASSRILRALLTEMREGMEQTAKTVYKPLHQTIVRVDNRIRRDVKTGDPARLAAKNELDKLGKVMDWMTRDALRITTDSILHTFEDEDGEERAREERESRTGQMDIRSFATRQTAAP